MRQRGQMLVMAVAMIVLVALMVVTLGFLYVSNEGSSAAHSASDQAYSVAVSGLEVATRQFSTGTVLCASLAFPGGAVPSTQVGTGTFATTGTLYPVAFTATLQAGIANTNAVPFIPLTFTVGSIVNLAPHGEILIGTEFITYSGTGTTAAACSSVAQPCLTGVIRATNGTTIAAHLAGVAVTQVPQCLIRSTGTVQPASRIVESTVASNAAGSSTNVVSNLFSGASVSTPTSGTTYSLTGGAWAPGFSSGDNYVIAVVTFQDTTAGVSTINAGNVKIVATNPASASLVASTFVIDFGGGPASDATTIFPTETLVLLAKHTLTGNATYDLQVTPNTTSGAAARGQILVINGIKAANASFFPSGASTLLDAVANLATSPNTPLPAGDNIIIAQVQIDNGSNNVAGRTIAQGDLAIRRGTGTGGPVLMSNRFAIGLTRRTNTNHGTGFLLLALDPGAAAGTQYSVTGLASNTNVNATASLLVFNGLSAALQPPITSQPPASFTFGAAAASLGSVTDTFSAGERVVLAGIQYSNASGGARNIAAGNETVTLGAAAVSSPASANVYNWSMCTTATSVLCDDFFTALLWRSSTSLGVIAAKPTFGVQSRADGATMTGAVNILTIDLSVREVNRLAISP